MPTWRFSAFSSTAKAISCTPSLRFERVVEVGIVERPVGGAGDGEDLGMLRRRPDRLAMALLERLEPHEAAVEHRLAAPL